MSTTVDTRKTVWIVINEEEHHRIMGVFSNFKRVRKFLSGKTWLEGASKLSDDEFIELAAGYSIKIVSSKYN